MFATYLIVIMGGAYCEAVAVCPDGAQSCEAVVFSCDQPVALEACLDAGAAFPAHVQDRDNTDPLYVLGCSTDLTLGWPLTVDVDADELRGAL